MLETLALVVPLMLSPGPANVVAFALAAQHGLAKTTRFLGGVLLVYGLIACAVGWFSASLLQVLAPWRAVWQTLGGLFVIWLGWSVWRRTADPGSHSSATPTLRDGVLLQLLNPKYPAVALTVYGSGAASPWWVQAALLTAVDAVGLWAYAALGAATDRGVEDPLSARRRDAACGLLLALVGVWLIGRAWLATASG